MDSADDEDWSGVAAITIFGWRMARAFPGARGWTILEGEEAADRLAILLEKPLSQQKGDGLSWSPIWWFRAGMSSSIEAFQRLGPTVCLIDPLEFNVVRLAAWRQFDERREFVYVETGRMDPTGLYPEEPEPSDLPMYSEQYALFGSHFITQAEYEDGHAFVDGTVTRVRDAEYRMRLVHPTNFIITGQSSPINSVEFDRISGPILDGLLRGDKDLEELRDAILRLPHKNLDHGLF